MSDVMLNELILLQQKLDAKKVNFILGGGLSAYLRHKYLKKQSHRYAFVVDARATQDIDIFLSSSVIVDHKKVNELKAVLNEMGYKPYEEALYFQFVKDIKLMGMKQVLKIDLLASPPGKEDEGLVKINKPRIRPRNSKFIHAYLTPESFGIEFGKVVVEIKNDLHEVVSVFIPSAFNYLILKLYAFNDRKNDAADKSGFGRHHAFDIFATVCQMDESDWVNAEKHLKKDRDCEYIKKACEIRKANFSTIDDIGMIRLKESQNYVNQKQLLAAYQKTFLKDVQDLFP